MDWEDFDDWSGVQGGALTTDPRMAHAAHIHSGATVVLKDDAWKVVNSPDMKLLTLAPKTSGGVQTRCDSFLLYPRLLIKVAFVCFIGGPSKKRTV